MKKILILLTSVRICIISCKKDDIPQIPISYFLPQKTNFTIELYDIYGKKYKNLEQGTKIQAITSFILIFRVTKMVFTFAF